MTTLTDSTLSSEALTESASPEPAPQSTRKTTRKKTRTPPVEVATPKAHETSEPLLAEHRSILDGDTNQSISEETDTLSQQAATVTTPRKRVTKATSSTTARATRQKSTRKAAQQTSVEALDAVAPDAEPTAPSEASLSQESQAPVKKTRTRKSTRKTQSPNDEATLPVTDPAAESESEPAVKPKRKRKVATESEVTTDTSEKPKKRVSRKKAVEVASEASDQPTSNNLTPEVISQNPPLVEEAPTDFGQNGFDASAFLEDSVTAETTLSDDPQDEALEVEDSASASESSGRRTLTIRADYVASGEKAPISVTTINEPLSSSTIERQQHIARERRAAGPSGGPLTHQTLRKRGNNAARKRNQASANVEQGILSGLNRSTRGHRRTSGKQLTSDALPMGQFHAIEQPSFEGRANKPTHKRAAYTKNNTLKSRQKSTRFKATKNTASIDPALTSSTAFNLTQPSMLTTQDSILGNDTTNTKRFKTNKGTKSFTKGRHGASADKRFKASRTRTSKFKKEGVAAIASHEALPTSELTNSSVASSHEAPLTAPTIETSMAPAPTSSTVENVVTSSASESQPKQHRTGRASATRHHNTKRRASDARHANTRKNNRTPNKFKSNRVTQNAANYDAENFGNSIHYRPTGQGASFASTSALTSYMPTSLTLPQTTPFSSAHQSVSIFGAATARPQRKTTPKRFNSKKKSSNRKAYTRKGTSKRSTFKDSDNSEE